MNAPASPDLPAFLAGGGEMAGRIAAFDWAATPLGALAEWPGYMRSATALMLRTRVPMIMLWGDPTTMVYNDGYAVIAGARHPQILGQLTNEGWPEVADFNDQVKAVVLAGGSLHYEDQPLVLRRHGRDEAVWLNLDYSPLCDDTGRPVGVMAVVVETTSKVLAERRVHSERAHRDALARLSDALRDARDPEAIVMEASQVLGETLRAGRVGYAAISHAAETVQIDRNWTAPGVQPVLGEVQLRRYGSFVDDLKRNETVAIADVQVDPRTADKREGLHALQVRSLVNVPVVEHGQLVAMLFVNDPGVRVWDDDELALIRDVAHRTRLAVERARGEAAASRLGREFRALVTATSDIVYRMDPDWRRLRYLEGRGFIANTEPGHPRENWLDDHIPAEERPRVLAAVQAAMRDRSVFELEHAVWREDGGVGWVFSRAIPLLDPEGRIVEWFGVASDVTRRKQVELELQDREERLRRADRRKDEFLATLAHELRNPLAPIRNAVHLLGLTDREGRFASLRGLLERQVNHMVRLVDDLLEVSRISRGQVTLRQERLNLGSIVEAAIESSRPLIDQACHRLTVHFAPPTPWVSGDAVRLTQLLVNLLNNAARYTDPGGAIDVTVQREGDEAVVTVADTGIGLSADQLPRLFELFSQMDRSHARSQGGLGIGLSLAQTLAQLHGGGLTAASAGLGHGSRFQLRLPTVAAPAAPPVDVPDPDTPLTARLLLVDDNRDAADTTAELLRLMGAEVEVAYDGAGALASVQRVLPDAVLLDIGMPGMDGHEVARRIRQWGGTGGRPRLIALTGWGQEQDREKTQAAGFDDHMVKPVDAGVLRRVLAGR